MIEDLPPAYEMAQKTKATHEKGPSTQPLSIEQLLAVLDEHLAATRKKLRSEASAVWENVIAVKDLEAWYRQLVAGYDFKLLRSSHPRLRKTFTVDPRRNLEATFRNFFHPISWKRLKKFSGLLKRWSKEMDKDIITDYMAARRRIMRRDGLVNPAAIEALKLGGEWKARPDYNFTELNRALDRDWASGFAPDWGEWAKRFEY